MELMFVRSWKPEVMTDGEWSSPGLRFATEEEAQAYADNLKGRWTLVTATRAAPSSDPPNSRLVLEDDQS